jgi:thiamine pyrophosphokinase
VKLSCTIRIVSDPTAVLVANGRFRWTARLVARAESATVLLAADGGANALADVGLAPEVVIGDLDSIRPGVRRWLGASRMVERPDQDRTDLDKAIEYALDERGLDGLTVLGALGGRIDHAIGNLGLLARRALGERMPFVGPDHRVVALRERTELASRPGETWSFWTFDPGVRVTLEGVRWAVVEQPLDVGGRPSISNEAASDAVTVTPLGGPVVAMRWLTPTP